ncbi:helix-turn-helix domain-containing protein [Pseudescherichia sp.]|uniref:helix-turn-helix domain-containing protein n=1 Tax=Pseudescherichia sp. TaxID=2055881 RepID=UPI00289B5C3A|nr:helix-turn-helix domain-containing protein [Pseudescherichia sp.]
MELHKINKPLDSINTILSQFPVTQPSLLEPGQTLPVKAKNEHGARRIYFLLDGAMICSVGENEKKQNLGIMMSPSIIGLAQLAPAGAIALHEAITPCMVDSISVGDFIKIIEEKQLWPDVINIMVAMINSLAARTATSGLQSAYDIIRSYLIYMNSENGQTIKERYTVVKYMQTFSRLSRSIILKILSELKAGGFIEMEKGRLIRINRNLPERF